MSQKIWYRYDVVESKVPNTDSILEVKLGTFDKIAPFVEESIALQQSSMKWDGMWNIEEAKNRLLRGDRLFLLRNHQATGHVWFDEDYLYNLYVHPSREEGQTGRFVQETCERVGFDSIKLYCDDWNVGAQKMFERVGFNKSNSYL